MKSITHINSIGPYAGQDRESAERGSAFRRRHHVGQILHGKVLRWVRGGMAWVQVGGHTLLAELHAKPEQGVPLRFLVVQLVPDIILREVADDGQQDAAGMFASPQAAMAHYYTSRDVLDTMLHARLWPVVPQASGRPDRALQEMLRGLFAAFIAENADALAAYVQMQAGLVAVNHLLLEAGGGRLRYAPWLLPQARGVELLYRPAGTDASGAPQTPRLTLGAVLPFSGCAVMQCLAGTERMAYRLFLERTGDAAGPYGADRMEALCRGADEAVRGAIPVTCLGIGPLPAGIHDVLTSVLSGTLSRAAAGGGLNRRA